MAENTVEIESVTFSEDWIGGVEDENVEEVIEVEFKLKSDNEESPEISGTVSYKASYPHIASLKVLNAKLASAFAEVAACLSEWAESALEDAKIGRKR
ncbi:MAG: hypothetical protein F4Y86_08380 [Gammaproteobacteria bacterium]|nr:hypothetical protein [Gammaproteobacteria bacterium]